MMGDDAAAIHDLNRRFEDHERSDHFEFGRLHERFDSLDDAVLEAVHEAKKTNGRVTALELDRAVRAALTKQSAEQTQRRLDHVRWRGSIAISLLCVILGTALGQLTHLF